MYNIESLKDVPVGTIVTADVEGTPVTVSVELVPDEMKIPCKKCAYGDYCVATSDVDFCKIKSGCFCWNRKDEESVYFPKKE